MQKRIMIVITGGAGFIGSHLTDYLIKHGKEVIIIDNLEFSDKEELNKRARLINLDISKDDFVKNAYDELKDEKIEAIFHYAADPDVKRSMEKPRRSFEINVKGTFNILELSRKLDSDFVFASTSAVYGIAEVIPTPEKYYMNAESNYAASKIAGEAYAQSFSNIYGIKSTILRYANIFGERSNHGVMYDFFHKLRKNKNELEILGNGEQEKSYLYIKDAIKGSLIAYEKQKKKFDVFNIGSEEKIKVIEIAKIISEYFSINPEFKFTSNESKGWKGDVPLMMLDIRKIKEMGFKPEYSIKQGIARYMRWLEEKYGF